MFSLITSLHFYSIVWDTDLNIRGLSLEPLLARISFTGVAIGIPSLAHSGPRADLEPSFVVLGIKVN